MPAPYTVTLIDEPDHPLVFSSTPNGFEGERWYRVGTDDPAKAVNPALCPGVPVYGDGWDAGDYADCKCVNVRAQRGGGREQGTRVGFCWVRTAYSTPSEDFQILPTEPGTKWTEVQAGQTTQTLFAGYEAGAKDHPINNGDGYNVNVGIVSYVVTRNWPVGYLTEIDRLNTLIQKQVFNDAEVVLPPVLGTIKNITLAKGQCQLVGFTAQVVGRSLRIQYTLVVGLSRFYKWLPRLPDGKYAASAYESEVYGEADFSNLW